MSSKNKVKMKATGLQTPLQYIKGVGPQRAKLLDRMGLRTVEDALFFFPHRHEDRSQLVRFQELRMGEHALCAGQIVGLAPPPPGKPRLPLQALLRDETGFLAAVWFNQPYLGKLFKRGQRVLLYGKVGRYGARLQMQQPEYEILDDKGEEDCSLHMGRLVPVYPLTEGLGQKPLRSLIWRMVQGSTAMVPELLPPGLLRRLKLPPLGDAIYAMHFPQTAEQATWARRRLAFDDFLLLQLGMALRRGKERREATTPLTVDGPLLRLFRESLPFTLTPAQERVWSEIASDLVRHEPMNRLLEGDVGSGKTVIAVMALLAAVDSRLQGALMAPTEILAEQHYITLHRRLERLGVSVALLTSGQKSALRKRTLAAVKSGEIQVVVGTHALIQEGVEFARLGTVVIDEQHRFGVLERAKLRAKGQHPHVLVMTATPIPRTLALSLYGDLDLSVIDQMPPGRHPITTRWRMERGRGKIYEFLRGELRAGRQIYVVYPLVEESEAVDLKAATEMAEQLAREVFPQFRVGLIHGRMGFEEKEAVMLAFGAGEIQILVATTVVEVGIDVSNATVMLVEHAERFGLAQLHQLRGRVGRGPWKSSCILLTGESVSEEARRRLQAMVGRQDGFKIAEVDLEIRGPGEFFGTRQSGAPPFRVANLVTDGPILERARHVALEIAGADPRLERPEHQELRRELLARWRTTLGLATVG